MLMILFLILILAIFAYVVTAKGLAKVANHVGVSPVLAWIPLVNMYVIYKAVDAKVWAYYLYLATYLISLFTNNNLDRMGVLSLILTIVINVTFIASSIYLLVVIYRLTKKYDCSTLLFFIGIIIFPLHIYLYYKIGKVAEQRQIEEEKEIEFTE